MRIAPGSKLLFIGDSITDSSRVKPAGEGLFDAYGKGYVSQVEALLSSIHPARRIRVVNQGVSGNTVRELQGRWQADVLAHEPDWLSVLIGINDVWRHFDLPLQAEIHVSPAEYEAALEGLVGATRPLLRGLVLMSPYMIEPHRAEPMRSRMDLYGEIVRQVAARNDALFVDLQAAFDRATAHRHPMSLAWDRIHPGAAGHMVIARAFLNAVGFSWNDPEPS